MQKLLLLIVCLACLPNTASALALGALEVQSSLNQRLEARILLHRVDLDEVDDIQVGLGDKAAFIRAGLERSFVLTSLRFTVRQSDTGETYIAVSSKERIREPYLNFVVDVYSPSGHILKEYSLLLNAAGS